MLLPVLATLGLLGNTSFSPPYGHGPTANLTGPARETVLAVQFTNATEIKPDEYKCDWMLLEGDAGNQAVSDVYVFNWRDYRPGAIEDRLRVNCPHYPAHRRQTLSLEVIGPSPQVPSPECTLWWRGPGPNNPNMATMIVLTRKRVMPGPMNCLARVINT